MRSVGGRTPRPVQERGLHSNLDLEWRPICANGRLMKEGTLMAREQSIAVATVFAIGLTFAPAARANPVSEVCTALGEARISLYSMLHAKDRSAQDALKAKMQAASNKQQD